jgi:hypothetical protein
MVLVERAITELSSLTASVTLGKLSVWQVRGEELGIHTSTSLASSSSSG